MCLGARERSLALVVLVDVDEAVAFLHLAGAGGDEVDGARGAVADEVDAVFIDGFFHLLDVGAQVGDARVVLHHTVFVWRLMQADSVLDDHQGHFVALLEDVQGIAEADGVDGPAPVGDFEIRVLTSATETLCRPTASRLRAGGPHKNFLGNPIGEPPLLV